MDRVLRNSTHVGGETHLAVVGAAEGGAEEGIQMREERELVAATGARGKRVGNDGSSTSTVEEVDGSRNVVTVGGLERTAEVGKEVDGLAVISSRSEDTRHIDQAARQSRVASALSCEVSQADSVDKKGQKSVLVGGSVVCEQSNGVLVTARWLAIMAARGADSKHDLPDAHVLGNGSTAQSGSRDGDIGEVHVDEVLFVILKSGQVLESV